MANKNKKICSPEPKDISIPRSELPDYLYKNEPIVVSFSFKTAFLCCNLGDFNNFLKDEADFVCQFRGLTKMLRSIGSKKMNELTESNGYRHCHKASRQDFAMDIIRNLCERYPNGDDYYQQNFEGEDIHQIGLNDSLRLYGIKEKNVFKVVFIDWFHSFDYSQPHNQRNLRNYKFEPVKD